MRLYKRPSPRDGWTLSPGSEAAVVSGRLPARRLAVGHFGADEVAQSMAGISWRAWRMPCRESPASIAVIHSQMAGRSICSRGESPSGSGIQEWSSEPCPSMMRRRTSSAKVFR